MNYSSVAPKKHLVDPKRSVAPRAVLGRQASDMFQSKHVSLYSSSHLTLDLFLETAIISPCSWEELCWLDYAKMFIVFILIHFSHIY